MPTNWIQVSVREGVLDKANEGCGVCCNLLVVVGKRVRE